MKNILSILTLIVTLCVSLNVMASDSSVRLLAHDYSAERDKGKGPIRLKLQDLKLNIAITDHLAETSMEMTFYNPSDKVLEGELIFPMPAGSVLTGYALDVKGVMIDGVMVEKKRARKTYESIVRQGIDPGLLELEKGNVFKTKVYPIVGKGTRSIRVAFISDLLSGDKITDYELPVEFSNKINNILLNIKIPASQGYTKIELPKPLKQNAKREGSSYVIKGYWKNKALRGHVRIRVKASNSDQVQVAQHENGNYFFYINDVVPDHKYNDKQDPKHITILWDASKSRQQSNRQLELKFLEKYLRSFKGLPLKIDILVFRHKITDRLSLNFEGKPTAVIRFLEKIRFDGASNLGSIGAYDKEQSPDYYILFTDGKDNYTASRVNGFNRPVYIFNSSVDADTAYLKYLSQHTHGDFFDLSKINPEVALDRVGYQAYRFISAEIEGETSVEIYPNMPESITNERFMLSGQFDGEELKITLNYGVGDTVLYQKTYHVSQDRAYQGNILGYLWAQKKIDALHMNADVNRQAVIAVSQEYGVVTPYTDLLVLEDIDQYLEHQIRPPLTMPEWVKDYDEEVKELNADLAEERKEKMENVIEDWDKLKAWWSTEFPRKVINVDKKLPVSTESDPSSPSVRLDMAQSTTGLEFSQEMLDSMPVDNSFSQTPLLVPGPGDGAENDNLMFDEVIVLGARISSKREHLASVKINAWSSERPYLKALQKASSEDLINEYYHQRYLYENLPAFYIEVSDFFRTQGDKDLGLQILSNLMEIADGDYALLRTMGYKLIENNEFELAVNVFQKILDHNTDEPQSYRDFGLALAQLADKLLQEKADGRSNILAAEYYQRAISSLYQVVTELWDDRFDGIEMICLMEINNIISKGNRVGLHYGTTLDPKLIAMLDVDVRIVIGWNADRADMDLWVIEPNGEKAFYGNSETKMGGRVSQDMIEGFGPEEYMIRNTVKGKFQILVNYFGTDALMPTGAVKVRADVYLNYGRSNEQHQVLTLELENKEDEYLIGEIEY